MLDLVLLRVRQDHPVLEQNESGYGGCDYDNTERLASRVAKENISGRDYLRLRGIDQTIYLMGMARRAGVTSNSKVLLLINEYVTSSQVVFAPFKS